MTAPSWLDVVVSQFGRQLGLSTFRLSERGTAAVTFENGVNLSFEYVEGALMVSVSVESGDGQAEMKRLFTAVHPSAGHGGPVVRAAYLARSRRALYAVRIAEREVTVNSIGSAFNELWRLILAYGRNF